MSIQSMYCKTGFIDGFLSFVYRVLYTTLFPSQLSSLCKQIFTSRNLQIFTCVYHVKSVEKRHARKVLRGTKLTASLNPLQNGSTFSIWQIVQLCCQTPVVRTAVGLVEVAQFISQGLCFRSLKDTEQNQLQGNISDPANESHIVMQLQSDKVKKERERRNLQCPNFQLATDSALHR